MGGRVRKNILIRLLVAVAVFSMISGCNTLDLKNNRTATGKPVNKTTKERPKAPVYYDFKDVLVPGEFVENKKYSSVAENSGMATGFMSFYGPVEVNSVVNFFNIKMPIDGWRPVTVSKSPLSTLMMFNKGNRWCYIELSETEFTTDLRIGISLEIGKPESVAVPEADVITEPESFSEPIILPGPSGVIEE
jgi:hypothetical protein